ncbi:hypothetical protein AB0I66_24490 [Streptomyces sp. NPDC050439]|uniref:hypothetical protein n=1 Tax=unclassified Streptomyces TaxID=2593676 RepID=UPI003445F047
MSTKDALSPTEALALPAMPTAQDAFRALNIGSTAGYKLIETGEFPIPIVRMGRHFRVRRAELLAEMGLTEPAASELQPEAATHDDAPGVQPGAPSEQPAQAPTSASK